MKKLIFTLLTFSILASSNGYAASCEVPEFIEKGSTVTILTGMSPVTSRIVEVDKKACWIKIEKDEMWINLNGIVGIRLKGK